MKIKLKVISMLVMITILFASFSFASEEVSILDDIQITPMELISEKDNFDKKIIVFDSLNSILANKNNEMNDELYISLKNKENIKEVIKFVGSLELVKKGQSDLEKQIIKGIKELEINGGYIEEYVLYIPKETEVLLRSFTSPVYYGTYNNHQFREYFEEYVDAYQRHSYDTNKHEQWAKGIINFSLNFAPKIISIPYTLLELKNRNDIITFKTLSIRHDGSDRVTKHYITIQDLYNIIGVGSNQYYVTIIDEARVNTTDSVIDYADPSKPTVVDNISYMQSVYCSTWSNSKSSQMIRGYNQFYYDPGVPKYNLVGRFSIPW